MFFYTLIFSYFIPLVFVAKKTRQKYLLLDCEQTSLLAAFSLALGELLLKEGGFVQVIGRKALGTLVRETQTPAFFQGGLVMAPSVAVRRKVEGLFPASAIYRTIIIYGRKH